MPITNLEPKWSQSRTLPIRRLTTAANVRIRCVSSIMDEIYRPRKITTDRRQRQANNKQSPSAAFHALDCRITDGLLLVKKYLGKNTKMAATTYRHGAPQQGLELPTIHSRSATLASTQVIYVFQYHPIKGAVAGQRGR
jgi:hypothetical protein